MSLELLRSQWTRLALKAVGVAYFHCFVIVSWGGLTSSKLKAPSYEAAGTRVPTTDHRLPAHYRSSH